MWGEKIMGNRIVWPVLSLEARGMREVDTWIGERS